MLDLLQYYFQVLCNGMKTRFRMVVIAHPGPGIGFHKRFMWQIIILPTTDGCVQMWKCGQIWNTCACACTECQREMGGGGGHLMGAPTNQCKQGKAHSPGLSLCLPVYGNDKA